MDADLKWHVNIEIRNEINHLIIARRLDLLEKKMDNKNLWTLITAGWDKLKKIKFFKICK